MEGKKPREFVITNRSEKEELTSWVAIERFVKILSLLAVPIVLAIGGWWIQNALSKRNVSKDYVELAVSILANSDDDIDAGLRSWAVKLLNHNSPVPFDENIAQKLSSGEVDLSTIVGERFESISKLSQTDPRRLLSNSIGRLDVLFEESITTCTAWLLGNSKIITTDYCALGQDGNTPNDLNFLLGYIDSSDTEDARRFSVNLSSIVSDSRLGYAILDVAGEPGKIFGVLEFSNTPPSVGDSLFMAHHARGASMSFSLNPCQVVAVDPDGIHFDHNCDSLPGTSGAPLLRNTDNKAIGIHYSSTGVGEEKKGTAVRIDSFKFSK